MDSNLHFNFQLAPFRYEKIFTKNLNTATVFGFCEPLGGKGCFNIQGDKKITTFATEIILKVSEEKQNMFVLYVGDTIFAVATTIGPASMETLEYLLVYPGTEDINRLMRLNPLDSYMHSFLPKFHLLNS